MELNLTVSVPVAKKLGETREGKARHESFLNRHRRGKSREYGQTNKHKKKPTPADGIEALTESSDVQRATDEVAPQNSAIAHSKTSVRDSKSSARDSKIGTSTSAGTSTATKTGTVKSGSKEATNVQLQHERPGQTAKMVVKPRKDDGGRTVDTSLVAVKEPIDEPTREPTSRRRPARIPDEAYSQYHLSAAALSSESTALAPSMAKTSRHLFDATEFASLGLHPRLVSLLTTALKGTPQKKWPLPQTYR